ncbi:MAG: PAS domain S-box protein [Deltaproteobacteria bacterium]|nr:PAS domain S-box protein [Deltaproteobacteria bacterium]
MAPELSIWCCPNFQREVAAVVAGSPELAGWRVETYDLNCLQGSQKARASREALFASSSGEATAILGGGCLQSWELAGGYPAGAGVLAPAQCFHLLAPAGLVDSLIAEGAFLLTPGWLADWPQHLAEWGFDQATAREFFQESTRKLVLLDSGVIPGCQAELVALAEYLGLPWQVIPVGLDMLRLHLERLVLDLSRGGQRLPPPEQYFADHFMVFDLLNELLSADGEQEALGRLEELCAMLFAPGRLSYTPAGPEPTPGEEAPEAYTWSPSGRGFSLHLRHGSENLGVLELDDLAFAQYKERYLDLALPLARVSALALANARDQEAHQKAREALQRKARIVESSDDAIIGQTLEGHIVSWNRGARRIFGYPAEEVLGRHISFLTPPDQPDALPRMLAKIRDGQPAEKGETAWRTQDGRRLNISLQVSAIWDDNGQIVGASSIARDITEEKERAAKAQRDLEAQLLQAQKMESVGRLAGGVAHDFNNMLAVILGYAELALMIHEEDNELRQSLQQILAAAERAKGLTRQLLAFARKQVLEMTNLNLNQVVQGFGKMIERLIGEDIKVELHLADDLPQVNADPSMLEQVLLNLAVNAKDAMPDGGILGIETSAVALDHEYTSGKLGVAPGDYVMLSVSDSGQGMDEITRQHLFEPFFTTKGPGKGTGLGLSTVYGIVKQHGGSIWVYSEPGHGAVFKVYLPVASPKGDVAQALVEEAAPPPRGVKLLLVEDEQNLRDLISAALTKLGYQVLCAAGPQEAQELVARQAGAIQVMLTDVVMPEMNGRTLYESLAPRQPGMKVIYMSGYTENVIAHQGTLQKGISFIQKPFSLKQLAGKLALLLASEGGNLPPAKP